MVKLLTSNTKILICIMQFSWSFHYYLGLVNWYFLFLIYAINQLQLVVIIILEQYSNFKRHTRINNNPRPTALVFQLSINVPERANTIYLWISILKFQDLPRMSGFVLDSTILLRRPRRVSNSISGHPNPNFRISSRAIAGTVNGRLWPHSDIVSCLQCGGRVRHWEMQSFCTVKKRYKFTGTYIFIEISCGVNCKIMFHLIGKESKSHTFSLRVHDSSSLQPTLSTFSLSICRRSFIRFLGRVPQTTGIINTRWLQLIYFSSLIYKRILKTLRVLIYEVI